MKYEIVHWKQTCSIAVLICKIIIIAFAGTRKTRQSAQHPVSTSVPMLPDQWRSLQPSMYIPRKHYYGYRTKGKCISIKIINSVFYVLVIKLMFFQRRRKRLACKTVTTNTRVHLVNLRTNYYELNISRYQLLTPRVVLSV